MRGSNVRRLALMLLLRNQKYESRERAMFEKKGIFKRVRLFLGKLRLRGREIFVG